MPFHPLWGQPLLALPLLPVQALLPRQELELPAPPQPVLELPLAQEQEPRQGLPQQQAQAHQALKVPVLPQQELELEPLPGQELPQQQVQGLQALRVQALPQQELEPVPQQGLQLEELQVLGLPLAQGPLLEKLPPRLLARVLPPGEAPLRVEGLLLLAEVAARPPAAEVAVEQQP
jgi:hypothetical protein